MMLRHMAHHVSYAITSCPCHARHAHGLYFNTHRIGKAIQRWQGRMVMMGVAFGTKKQLREHIGKDLRSRIIETSVFGSEYQSDMAGEAVVVSFHPDKVRTKFAQIWTVKNILTKVL